METPVANPDYAGIPGLFTDLDIYTIAARGASWRSDEDRKRAFRAAQNLMHTLYNDGLVVRYGPVVVPEHEDAPDCLRWQSRIIYASVEHAPELVRTPNGVYGRMFAQGLKGIIIPGATEDATRRPGRRSPRNDFELWESQAALVGGEEDQREVERLEIELRMAQNKLQSALLEIERLRQHNTRSFTPEQVVEAVNEALAVRLA